MKPRALGVPLVRALGVPLVRALGVLLLVAVAACDTPPAAPPAPIACAAGTIAGQGSSAQANALAAWIRDYQIACPAATVAYASVGSGAGIKTFLIGTGDFAGSDSPLTPADQPRADARCRTGPAVHLPMVVGPIALAYNLAGVDGLRLRPATVARIFAGTVTVWNDPAIAADNPGAALPATRIAPVHRSDNSGTTANFTAFLAATAAWPFPSAPAWPAPGGLPRKGSNGVTEAITRTDGAIGYVEASYARFHELPTARIGNAAGEFTPLTDDAAARTVATAKVTGTTADLRLAIDYRTPTPGAYPIVLVTYEIVCGAGAAPLTKSFLRYAAGPAGQATLTRVGYAPLPESLRSRVAAAVAHL